MCLYTTRGVPFLTLFDTGASITLIRPESAQRLGLEEVSSTNLTIAGFSNTVTSVSKIYKVSFTLPKSTITLNTLIADTPYLPTTEFLAPSFSPEDEESLRLHHVDVDQIVNTYKHDYKPIDVILGNDIISWMQKHSKRIVLPSGRVVDITPLGAVAFRPLIQTYCPATATPPASTLASTVTQTREDLPTPTHRSTTEEEWDISLSEEIAQMWKMENIGINAPSSEEKKETTDLIKEFKNNLNELESGEIEVAFPWNDNKNRLAHNFNMAFVRLKSNFDRLQEKEMLEQYSAMFSEQLNINIIEMVTPEMDRAEGPTSPFPTEPS
uniref:Peptidase A2 domain-containing protein n=1 Tax=Caenorhabditis japonica TaxID=281687 RepID=A0A8R1HIM4_CAEJA